AHPRQVVLELRELHLELALGADGMLREDVEDQLCPIDDARLQGVFELPLLGGVELVVDDQRVRLRFAEGLPELLELALPHVRAPVRAGAMLDELADALDARRAQELAQLPELLALITPRW